MTMERKYSIGEFAKLTGMTERTLRHYDQTGILKPAELTEYGHRVYTNRSIIQLQKILVLKFLDLSLGEILAYVESPEQDLAQTIAEQKEMLLEKQKQIDTVIQTITQVQETVSGSDSVDQELCLSLFHALKNQEIRHRWLSEHESDSVYNRLHSHTVELELSKEMTVWSSKMKQFIHAGKAPNDPDVLAHTEALVSTLKPEVKPLLDKGARDELKKGEGSLFKSNPYLFPSAFNKEEERFIEKVIHELILSNMPGNQKGDKNGPL
ncbi:LOW QUALITY PROTEIN: transcriptional activator TipA [Bacillus sp. JCM 19047]|nr:LOW QUALITY PROTEIN: transcriptional activator TipA [Bacillus sp. JCM 19047]